MLKTFTQKNYWSDYLAAPLKDRRISFVSMWRNKYVGGNESDKHYFSVYPGHPSEDDFRKVYMVYNTNRFRTHAVELFMELIEKEYT